MTTLATRQRLRLLSPERRSGLYALLKDSDPLCGKPPWSVENPSGCRSQFHPAHHPGQGYIPSDKQREILDDDHLNNLIWGGYRSGKSGTASLKAALLTISFFYDHYDRASGQVAWLVGATYPKVQAEFAGPESGLSITEILSRVWPGAVRSSTRLDPGEIKVKTPCSQHPPGSGLCTRLCKTGLFTIKTKSAEDATSLGMESPVWIILAEAAHTTHEVFLRCLSRVSETRSRFPGYGMLLLEGTADTPDASLGWYAQLWKEWQVREIQSGRNARSFSLSSGSNTFVYPGGEEDPELQERKAAMPPDRYSEWHLGVPVPPSGRVFTDFSPLVHLQTWNYDPELPVFVGIDPGYSGQPSRYAVEVAQIEPDGTWRFFDEVFVDHMKADMVADECTRRRWWANRDKKFIIDIAAKKETSGEGDPETQVWRRRVGAPLGHQKVNIMPGINRLAGMLRVNPLTGKPGVTFDPRRNSGVIAELGGGLDPISGQPRVYSNMRNSQGEVVGKTPADRYCDGIKAVTYLIVGVLGYADARGEERKTIQTKSWADWPEEGRKAVRV